MPDTASNSFALFWGCVVLACTCSSRGAGASLNAAVHCDPSRNLVAGARVETSSAHGAPGRKYSSAALNDGNAGTRWLTAAEAPPPHWVKATFPQPVELDTVVLILTSVLPDLYMTVKRVEVSFSDGATATVACEDRTGPLIIRFPGRRASWFKLTLAESWAPKRYYGVNELMAFHDPDGRIRRKTPVRQRWGSVDLTPTGRETHPCVYLTPADVERARANMGRRQWARDVAEKTIRGADQVVDKSPEWIREHCPGKDALFACGSTGCPVCGASWGAWKGAKCSFDRPGVVVCANGHALPDAEHPDDGSGYVASSGRVHYFAASYNAWVVETYQKWCSPLSFAFLMTGEEKYAETCAALLDALAEIYPHCTKGSLEYPSGHGRLSRPGYQTSRVLVRLVDFHDRIHGSAALGKPSFVPGLTRRQNIEKNMLLNGARYCYEKSWKGGLHNGTADYVRGCLAVGCLLGVDAYVEWAVNGPYGIDSLLSNNVDRDGRYYETALSYGNSTRVLYLTFADPLVNYRSARWPAGLNLYDDPRFRAFYVLPMLSLDCAGHWPRYGDAPPDVTRVDPAARPFDPRDYLFAERVCAQASDPEAKRDFAALVSFLAGGDVDKVRSDAFIKEWLLFHADDITDPGALPASLRRRLFGTTLMGQKGMALLRTPRGRLAQACLLRYGPVLNHGHFDTLNLNYYGLGYELTYDLGYGWGNTHTQVGWAKQTASHNLVLVNETRQGSGENDVNGGSLRFCAALPGLQLVDADASGVYRSQGVSTYRRCLALVGRGPGSYLVDVFSVAGGRQHDYLLHSLSADVSFENVELSDRAPGSLAGPDVNWGERQHNDGFMKGVPRKSYWNPPPGNGLGFMMHPRRGAARGTWHAAWRLPSQRDWLRLTMLPEADTEVINVWVPGIYPARPRAEHVAVRRTAKTGELRSTFVALLEPYGAGPSGSGKAEPFLRTARRPNASASGVALAVEHAGGAVDRFVYAAGGDGPVAAGALRLDGQFAAVRTEGERVVSAHLLGKSFSSPEVSIELSHGAYRSSIVRLDYERNLVVADGELPTDGRLDNQVIVFTNPAYARSTAYTIRGVRKQGEACLIDLGDQSVSLGKAVLNEDPFSATTFTSLTPHDYAMRRLGDARFFDGKLARKADGSWRSRILGARYDQPFEVQVESTAGLAAGDVVLYMDLQAGDAFVVYGWAALERTADGALRVTATDDVRVTCDGKTELHGWRSDGECGMTNDE